MSKSRSPMKPLPIVWQRLVNAQGQTCARCRGTGAALKRAVERLRLILEPLGVAPALELRALDPASFRDQPSESNRIWIAGKPVEDWIGARTGSSRCCGACGDQDCRTVEVDGKTHEVIPEDLLVRAGLKAGIGLLEPGAAATGAAGSQARPSCGGACCY